MNCSLVLKRNLKIGAFYFGALMLSARIVYGDLVSAFSLVVNNVIATPLVRCKEGLSGSVS